MTAEARSRSGSGSKSQSDRAPAKKRVTFRLDAPHAEEVLVTGSFCGWERGAYPLRKGKDGVWRKSIYLAPGRHEYRYIVDGNWQNDPGCAETVTNVYGSCNSVVTV